MFINALSSPGVMANCFSKSEVIIPITANCFQHPAGRPPPSRCGIVAKFNPFVSYNKKGLMIRIVKPSADSTSALSRISFASAPRI